MVSDLSFNVFAWGPQTPPPPLPPPSSPLSLTPQGP